MNEELKLQAIEHAKKEFPRESCGLVVRVENVDTFHPCKNIAEKDINFIIDPADYMKAEDSGKILSVFHSHCNIPATPSEADRVSCEKSGLTWHILSLPLGSWAKMDPIGYAAPLIGRTYSYGVLDCYSLITDFYKEKFKIDLMDFERGSENKESLYLENYEKAGFEEATDLKYGDLILMQIGGAFVNHAGIYLGNDLMLHHARNRLSRREVYGGFWKKCTRKVIRYKGLE